MSSMWTAHGNEAGMPGEDVDALSRKPPKNADYVRCPAPIGGPEPKHRSVGDRPFFHPQLAAHSAHRRSGSALGRWLHCAELAEIHVLSTDLRQSPAGADAGNRGQPIGAAAGSVSSGKSDHSHSI